MNNNYISSDAIIGKNVEIGYNCIIEPNVVIGDNTYIDSNTIIRSGTTIGENSFIGSNSIIGEYLMDFCIDRKKHEHFLNIGRNALIRSGSIIYTDSKIGDNFQTGHRVTIREKTRIGDHVSIGTLNDLQGYCTVGSYVRTHSNVHIAQKTIIDNFVWLFPYVVFTNDPTPPSDELIGSHVHSFAIIATGVTVLPAIDIGQDALVAAGSVVTKNVDSYSVVAGNPAQYKKDVRTLKNKITGKSIYPWRNSFKKYMPWEESDFDTWYSSIDFDEKKYYMIDKLM